MILIFDSALIQSSSLALILQNLVVNTLLATSVAPHASITTSSVAPRAPGTSLLAVGRRPPCRWERERRGRKRKRGRGVNERVLGERAERKRMRERGEVKWKNLKCWEGKETDEGRKYLCKREGIFLHVDQLRGPRIKIYFCMRPIKRTAWENRLIFTCGSLRGPHGK